MDVLVEEFNETEWQRSHALARLLFESGDIKMLGKQVRSFLKEGTTQGGDAEHDGTSEAWRSLRLVRDKFPWLKSPCHQPPVIWLRVGLMLQSEGAVLSNSFLVSYAEWRRACATERGATKVRYRNGSTLKIWPLDYFLLGRNLGIEIPSDGEVSLLHEREAKGGHKDRTLSDVVGRHNLPVIKECVLDAVVRKKIDGLTKEMDRERYICHLTRNELAHELQEQYPHMCEIGYHVIVRAVGKFVACGRPRRR